MTTHNNEKKNIYGEITVKIIDALETGVNPWARPWDALQYGELRNAVTNRPYRGLNTLLLSMVTMMKGFVDPRWLTFRNAAKLGGHVRKGESGTDIIFWKFLPLRAKSDSDDPDPEPDENGRQDVIPIARFYTVFNVEQCEGLNLPELATYAKVEQDVNEQAERILRLPVIKYGGGRAFYSNSRDIIVMPVRNAFESLNLFYCIGYHEISHWTGNLARLNRKFGKRFGDNNYAFEELVAEIGAAFLGAATGIPFEEMRHPEYINSWLQILKGDNRAIFTAAAKAQTAADYILDKAGLSSGAEEKLPVAA